MRILSISAIVAGLPMLAHATPISVDNPGNPWEVFHFRDVSGPTRVFGSPSGPRDILGFGANNVVPNGKGEDAGVPVSTTITTVTARQNGVTRNVPFSPDSVDPNCFCGGTDYDPSLTGNWELSLQNGNDTLVVNTPAVGNVAPPTAPTNVQITQSNDPTTPLITWTNGSTAFDRVSVAVFDLNRRSVVTGQADRVFIGSLPANSTSIQIPANTLDPDGSYSVRISSQIDRKTSDGTAGTNPSGSSQAGAALVRSSTYFEFGTGQLSQNTVFVPQVTFRSDGSPVYNFNNLVQAGVVEFYDPLVAVGYDYMVGESDPLFASFILPEIGDDLFDLYLWDGTDYSFETQWAAGDEFSFAGDGVDRFRILGIETGAGLDPNDPTAFVTGLSFAESGRFTGTMTPITVDVPTSPAPVPASLPLLLAGFGVFGMLRARA